MKLPRLKQRKDFVFVTQKGHRYFSDAFVLQYVCQRPASSASVAGTCDKKPGTHLPSWRVGFTVTKKIGSAVARNRVKRRLRSAAENVLPAQAKAGIDYVLVARAHAGKIDFQQLVADLQKALQIIVD
ncbi:MAG TPA: ribonuclease P protein component [Alphaproteobacteria bacterium]|jgi:ribonuclease P protein component|nr:ribonuclease P protein component [Alphaproteobacteria bacterium]